MKMLFKAAATAAVCIGVLYFLAAVLFGVALILFSFPAVIPALFVLFTVVAYKDIQWEQELKRLYG